MTRAAPFTSGLATPDFAALHGVGLDPVGQVTGALVVALGSIPYPCVLADGSQARMRSMSNGRQYAAQRTATGAWNARGTYNRYDRRTVDLGTLAREVRASRDEVLARLAAACRAVGGDGVVDVTVEMSFERERLGGRARLLTAARLLTLRISGTAVRARTGRRPPVPFTCDLSGVDVALLLRAGYEPTQIAWGVGASMRHGQGASEWGGPGTGTGELRGVTTLVANARRWARADLATHLGGTPAELSVLRTSTLHTWDTEPAEYHRHTFALVTMVGSGIAHRPRPTSSAALPVLSLARRNA